ncbi:MAG: cbb3-type cytochrome c oxidase subunit I [Bacteroidota bacterium]|nr:cbb3-type cytochrome c oxidase subunit I [Bacteroidota bacterium]
MLIIITLLILILLAAFVLQFKVKEMNKEQLQSNQENIEHNISTYISRFTSEQIDQYFLWKQKRKRSNHQNGNSGVGTTRKTLLFFVFLFFAQQLLAQGPAQSVTGEAGIVITTILILTPILLGIIIMIVKVMNVLKQYRNNLKIKEAEKLAEYLQQNDDVNLDTALMQRKAALDFSLHNDELSGNAPPLDKRGLIQTDPDQTELPIAAAKKRALKRPNIDPALSKLVLWYIGCAAFWLIFGTTIGEYIGIKFVAPDADHISWLSFGRLRPVHTNSVFWGWASLGMLGLGYYIVPKVSNAPLASIKKGWYALYFINAAVILGSLCLMAGINNAGGEYREYIWPVMALFGIGLVLTLINFLQTIARRTTKEIYISNWYIVSAIMFGLVIALVAYLPFWQDALGETIIQGYYMHQGVGMWFMLFTLGIVYYFLPQQLNRPIYSYSLGILAFWTQILFYTLIGTHHFVFSAIPWWLQTVAIVGSAGMAIPVIAGTTNFLMTFKGAWYKVSDSYTLPFFLVGIIFYFSGSMQGTAEAFRSSNLIWHFTDFTVAHSHLTMYGIISFFLWAGIYAVVPRLTGKEAPQLTIGAHFWFALVGLLFYTIPLMIGATLKGNMWIEGKPFIDSVVMMAPYWLWRAIGGSLMWFSHLLFAYNLYKMFSGNVELNVPEAALEKLVVNNSSESGAQAII